MSSENPYEPPNSAEAKRQPQYAGNFFDPIETDVELACLTDNIVVFLDPPERFAKWCNGTKYILHTIAEAQATYYEEGAVGKKKCRVLLVPFSHLPPELQTIYTRANAHAPSAVQKTIRAIMRYTKKITNVLRV